MIVTNLPALIPVHCYGRNRSIQWETISPSDEGSLPICIHTVMEFRQLEEHVYSDFFTEEIAVRSISIFAFQFDVLYNFIVILYYVGIFLVATRCNVQELSVLLRFFLRHRSILENRAGKAYRRTCANLFEIHCATTPSWNCRNKCQKRSSTSHS